MNYFPFHVGDYAAHTAHLEPMEDLAYRRLLDQYYLREGALPSDIQATAKLIRMRSFIADVESVLKEFFMLTDDGWTHGRCDSEIERMKDKQTKARASAKASVNARKARSLNVRSTSASESSNERSTDAKESQTDVELPTPTPTPTPTPIPIPINTPNPQRGQVCRFEEFWAAWPKGERKQDKVKCAQKWKRSDFDNVADHILQDIETKRQTEKWRSGYIEAPLVYLNGKRWEDGVTASSGGESQWAGAI